MFEIVNEPTNKYSDLSVKNIAQKQMEDKQVRESRNDLSSHLFDFSWWKAVGIVI